MGCSSSAGKEAKYAKQEKAAVAIAEEESAAKPKDEGNENAANDQVVEVDQDRQDKLQIVKEVYIFRHLSPHQLNLLLAAFKHASFKQGQKVFSQHDKGESFSVVTAGEVQVLINGNKVRNLGKNAYFGERALLFEEPRSATIECISAEVETWYVDKTTFMEIVRGKMQQQLMHRIRMQDTTVTMEDLKVVRKVGEGAAGSVDLVEHKHTHTRYALKQVKKINGKLPQDVEREIDLLKMNDHPFVLQLVKTFETEEHAYMLVELITGGELHAAIRTIPTVLGREQAQFYIASLGLALEALHSRKIVYRDLKPENVMLDQQGYLKIIDFGTAKKLEGQKARTYTTVGTPHYMAPEVMRGKPYAFSVDHWSLGVVLFELVVGYLPFANDLDSAQDVCIAVIKGTLEIPVWYKDAGGAEFMKCLMCHDPKKRLGYTSGFEELKAAKWWSSRTSQKGAGVNIFDQLMGRELDAPVVPKGEVYAIDTED